VSYNRALSWAIAKLVPAERLDGRWYIRPGASIPRQVGERHRPAGVLKDS
jgi:hypothetical protein